MTQLTKPYTINELVDELISYDESHIEFIDNMNGGDCDCSLHITLNTIAQVMGWNE